VRSSLRLGDRLTFGSSRPTLRRDPRWPPRPRSAPSPKTRRQGSPACTAAATPTCTPTVWRAVALGTRRHPRRRAARQAPGRGGRRPRRARRPDARALRRLRPRLGRPLSGANVARVPGIDALLLPADARRPGDPLLRRCAPATAYRNPAPRRQSLCALARRAARPSQRASAVEVHRPPACRGPSSAPG
jgi:hypothetical protein